MLRTVEQENKNFEIIPEGRDVFYIADVECDDNFNKVTLTIVNRQGIKCLQNFSFNKADGTYNTVALGIYNRIAKAALDLPIGKQYDDNDLKGKYFEATVQHKESKGVAKTGKYAGQERTYTNIQFNDLAHATGFPKVEEVVDDSDDVEEIDFSDLDSITDGEHF